MEEMRFSISLFSTQAQEILIINNLVEIIIQESRSEDKYNMHLSFDPNKANITPIRFDGEFR